MEATGPNAEQIEFWNGEPGRRWVRYQETLDIQIGALGRAAIGRLAPEPGERILDVGCGCGQSTLEIGRLVGDAGAVTGLDISATMLAHAASRVAQAGIGNVEFVNRDAATGTLPQGYDAVFSRFGVMFFADPVAAFSNLRAALRPGGRLGFICWRRLDENPWAALPLRAVAPHIELPEPPPAEAPGPFSFADPGRVEGVLREAGFGDICRQPHDDMMSVGGMGDIDRIAELMVKLGPIARVLVDADDDTKQLAARVVREAVAPIYRDDRVLLDAATWIFSARN